MSANNGNRGFAQPCSASGLGVLSPNPQAPHKPHEKQLKETSVRPSSGLFREPGALVRPNFINGQRTCQDNGEDEHSVLTSLIVPAAPPEIFALPPVVPSPPVCLPDGER